MKIELYDKSLDSFPGSYYKAIFTFLLGNDWEDYIIIYVKNSDFSKGLYSYSMHNEAGPAAIKRDGSMEWWLNGEKIFCQTQEQFECYIRNKAFW